MEGRSYNSLDGREADGVYKNLLCKETVETNKDILAPVVALIDADIVLHRVGFTTESDDFWIARVRCDEMLDGILRHTGVSEYQLWLSDNAANNFRYQIYPLYKANRIGKPRPKHHEELKAYLIQEWGARFADGMEADDYLGIYQDEEDKTTVICSIDKDLKQIPGLHYNFVKDEWDDVSRNMALKSFYEQIIVGDVSDNIPGAWKKGPVAAQKALQDLSDELSEDSCELLGLAAVRRLYKESLLKTWGEPWDLSKERAMLGEILLSGRLLKIRRSFQEELWGSQLLNQMEEYQSLYTLSPEVVSFPFMEPIMLTPTMDGFQSTGDQTALHSPHRILSTSLEQ